MATSTHKVGVQALEALGLPAKRCAGLSIHSEPNDLVRVEARYYPDEDALDEVISIVTTLKPAP